MRVFLPEAMAEGRHVAASEPYVVGEKLGTMQEASEVQKERVLPGTSWFPCDVSAIGTKIIRAGNMEGMYSQVLSNKYATIGVRSAPYLETLGDFYDVRM
jgi:hypothetical protein